MPRIIDKYNLNANTFALVIDAPRIARKAKAGQFVMLRVDDDGERIPLTIAGKDAQCGTVTIMFQAVGATTAALARLSVNDILAGLTGPLGEPSPLEGIRSACVVGGGLGCAIAYPQAQALRQNGARVDVIAGFRSADFVILQNEMTAVADNYHLCTDDGSAGKKALVTHILDGLLAAGTHYDAVIAVGPLIMMKFVCAATKPYGIKTIASLSPIMVDGTGMCGCCRVGIGGTVKFACVDGPDFDGHAVDFDNLILRNGAYRDAEAQAFHTCMQVTGKQEQE
jgi:ferredoxin--NADP+ reductase